MKKIPTSADILQRAVWQLIVFITLGFEIVIIGASGHQLYERVVINSQRIARKLVKTEIDSEFDWQHWRMNSNLDTENMSEELRTRLQTIFVMPSRSVFIPKMPNSWQTSRRVIFLNHFGTVSGLGFYTGPSRPKMAFATFYGTACTSRPRFLSASSG